MEGTLHLVQSPDRRNEVRGITMRGAAIVSTARTGMGAASLFEFVCFTPKPGSGTSPLRHYQPVNQMAELFLIRHGQASFDGDDYDQLSALGYRQCQWLGEYFKERGVAFERIVCGEMTRHRQSADAICQGLGITAAYETHPGFNEFDFQKLLLGFGTTYPDQAVHDWRNQRDVFRCLRQAMLAWSQEELPETAVPERWQAFAQRVGRALDFARQGAVGKTLICTSGGTISMALSQLMGFDANTLINTNLGMRNASISHCFYKQGSTPYVTGFNSVPHLDTPERLASISYI